jgi:UDPglucose--hexose-1-phosphate uridylyltransferase
MSEFRQDPTTGAFVISAPERGRRPGAPKTQRREAKLLARFDERCPFCPGNEGELAAILAETAAKDPPGWSVRVVSNKFPALVPEPPAATPKDGAHTVLPGFGFHEVIIESPHHDADLTTMAIPQIAGVLASYQARFTELLRRPNIAAVVLFRNHGTQSGASLVHPHAQVLALPLVPAKLQALAEWGDRRGRESSRCPTCAELERELGTGCRIVEESRSFVALVPFAAQRPCEQWLVPKRHQASFCETTEDELADLAGALRRALQRLDAALGDQPYNFAIESAGAAAADARYAHWRLRIVPENVYSGGFERSAGMTVNPSDPAADAALLRKSLGEDRATRETDT